MSEVELAYCAGLWDGEGCFCIHYKKGHSWRRTSPYWGLVASICMTDREAIEVLQQHFGGNILKYARKGIARDVYEWKLWSLNAAAFAKALLPYLRVKKQEAVLAIEFQEYITQQNRHGGCGNTLPLEDQQTRETFRQQMKSLNKRGKDIAA